MGYGFIKLSKKILNWQWYRNTNTKIVFIHLLLKAAWKQCVQEYATVKRGQCFVSQSKLSAAAHLTPGETRTALEHLQKTGEISVAGGSGGSLITIQNYDTYQSMDAAWYVQLHRKILDWGWYKNANTLSVFLHLLLTAKYKPETVDGETIDRGQLVTKIPDLEKALGMSTREIRTALAHLVETGEITDQSDNRGRVITVCKYDEYQGSISDTTGDDRVNSPAPAEKATGRQAPAKHPMRQADLSKATGTYDVQSTGNTSAEDGLPMPNIATSACAFNMPETARINMPLDENLHAACRSVDVPVNTPSYYKNIKNLKSEEGEETRVRAIPPCIPTNENDSLTIDDVTGLYLQLCPSLPPVSLSLTLPRRHQVSVLLRQYPDVQTIRTLFQKAESSAFLKGADGKWNADFDWLIDPTNACRVLEGKYDVLWEKTTRPGGYMPVSELEPTYDMQEYTDLSLKRLLRGI